MTGGPSLSKLQKRRKILRILAIASLAFIVTGVFSIGLLFAWVSRDIPDPDRLLSRQVQKSTKIWDRSGEHLLYEIHGEQNRTLVELNQISDVAIKAAIVSEDKDFYKHGGFQLKSLLRAFLQSFRRGRVEGTSTITQQLIKNAILTNERALTRKAKELILAYQIENKFSKDEILKMYFNEIPYGSSSYGIQAAAQSYFGKSAKDLDAAEGAIIASLTKAPSRLSPYGSNKDELIWWQQFILDDMAKQGYLTKEEAEAAKAIDIIARVKPRRDSIEAPHFVLHVKEILSDKYGEREVETGGLNVITTLDYEKQTFAEESVKDGMEVVKQYGGSNAALLSIDPKSGQVLAMVGSADYFDTENDGNVNITLRQRQPGSSFKPIVYAAAFERGYTPSTVVFDSFTEFPTDSGKSYGPRNYDFSEIGPVTLRKALAGSLNIPAVKALYLTGIDRALNFAEGLGYGTFRDRSRFGLSLVLGGAEIRLIEHLAAFSTFATEGTYRAPAFILKVEAPDGTVLEEWKDEPRPEVMSVQTARNINDILSDNGARAYVFGERNFLTLPDRPVAAKTGTTNLFIDAWTMGYTPNLAAGVWVGNNNSDEMKGKADGSRVAAPIWQSYMKKSLAGMAIERFVEPTPIVTGKPVLDGQAGEIAVKIDKFSGKLATENTPPTAIEERIYRQTHDILHYVDKNNPRGPYPIDASVDPHYSAWEAGAAMWAVKNGWTNTEAPPTETDDIHDNSNSPTVTFELPADNAEISVRSFPVRSQANAPRGVRRVEYSIDGVTLATATSYPWDAVITLPSTYNRGFYTLYATAFDDIEHSSSQDITINVTTDGIPLSVEWTRPTSDTTYRRRAFPIYIDTALSERVGVSKVDIVAQPSTGEPIFIDSLSNPATNGVSVTWSTVPEIGTYRLKAVVHLSNNELKTFDGPNIVVKD